MPLHDQPPYTKCEDCAVLIPLGLRHCPSCRKMHTLEAEVRDLRSQLVEMTSERDKLKQHVKNGPAYLELSRRLTELEQDNSAALARAEQAEVERDRLRAALETLADPNNWTLTGPFDLLVTWRTHGNPRDVAEAALGRARSDA